MLSFGFVLLRDSFVFCRILLWLVPVCLLFLADGLIS